MWGRLWVLDHHTGYIDYVERVTAPKDTRSILYAGRCVLYTRYLHRLQGFLEEIIKFLHCHVSVTVQ